MITPSTKRTRQVVRGRVVDPAGVDPDPDPTLEKTAKKCTLKFFLKIRCSYADKKECDN